MWEEFPPATKVKDLFSAKLKCVAETVAITPRAFLASYREARSIDLTFNTLDTSPSYLPFSKSTLKTPQPRPSAKTPGRSTSSSQKFSRVKRA
jgi:hypothetical protein